MKRKVIYEKVGEIEVKECPGISYRNREYLSVDDILKFQPGDQIIFNCSHWNDETTVDSVIVQRPRPETDFEMQTRLEHEQDIAKRKSEKQDQEERETYERLKLKFDGKS